MNDGLNLANENIKIDTKKAKDNIEIMMGHILDSMGIDWTQDPNTIETPKRVAKMYVDELLSGRFSPKPKATIFPNTKGVDQLFAVGPIPIVGVCSHHFLPITGNVWVGVIPEDKLLGLSKFARFADWVFSRPQIQEEATEQLADVLEEILKPKGIGIVCKAAHACMSLRGVKATDCLMTTSVMRGSMYAQAPRVEFFNVINGQGYV
tara:strand:+ start:1448 stop:2068 length:621 start_codon:yes stop_codon:yes gene_type:complete